MISFKRYVRGRKDIRKVRNADAIFVSYAKAGRTWVRTMISHLFHQRYGIPENELLEFDNFHRRNSAVPKIFFSATLYVWDASHLRAGRTEFDGRRVIFQKRDPRDVVVSYYFHAQNRINPRKLEKKRLPTNLYEMSLMEFVQDPRCGIRPIIGYMNHWEKVFERTGDHLLIGFEETRADPAPTLRRIGEFLGHEFTDEEIRNAIEFASFESLKQKEKDNFFDNRRLAPRNTENPLSFKVRRGKVGGYRDYFDEDQIEIIDGIVQEELSPYFGYS